MNIISHLYSPVNFIYSLTSNLMSCPTNYIKKPKHKINEVESIKLLILDMDGVLRIGSESINIAKESFNLFKRNNIPIVIITNECRRTPKKIKKELQIMGYNMDNVKVISASSLMLKKIKYSIFEKNNIKCLKTLKFKKAKLVSKSLNIGIISEESFYCYIKNNINNQFENINFFWIKDKTFKSGTITPKKLDIIIVGCLNINNNKNNKSNDEIDFYKLISSNWIAMNKNAELIITCPDKKDVENIETITTLLPSSIVEYINNNSKFNTNTNSNSNDNSKLEVFCPSKPNTQFLIKEIKDSFDIILGDEERNDVLMVGDNIDTDILLGHNLKVSTCLVLTGTTSSYDLKYREKELENINYIIPDLSYLNMY